KDCVARRQRDGAKRRVASEQEWYGNIGVGRGSLALHSQRQWPAADTYQLDASEQHSLPRCCPLTLWERDVRTRWVVGIERVHVERVSKKQTSVWTRGESEKPLRAIGDFDPKFRTSQAACGRTIERCDNSQIHGCECRYCDARVRRRIVREDPD